ncbi:MAG: copper chaperone PCu(A)C [Gammaproteobacteria bacterium]|nr:copper chaperone PCu(A)C [Gammaproteobacteria bacterium]
MADSSQVLFKNGWIKQLPPVVPMRAGYMSIENNSEQQLEIIAFQSDAFERVEMHETLMQDGIMKMQEQESFILPARSRVELNPGGKHLMLISPKQAMQLGDDINLVVTFSDNSTQAIQLEVRQ